MSFGKRGLPSPAVPATNRSATQHDGKSEDSSPVNTRRLFVIGAFLVVSTVVGWGVTKFTHLMVGSYVENQWATRGSLPFDKLVSELDTILVQDADKVELGVHEKCRAVAVAKFESSTKRKEDQIGAWARTGNEDRVQRIADYVACTMRDTPSRFCSTATRGRLFAYIQGYYDVQAHQLRINEEDRKFNPAAAIESAAKYPADLLTKTDKRIADGIIHLVAQGYIARDELLSGLAKPAVVPVAELLQGVEDVAARCESPA